MVNPGFSSSQQLSKKIHELTEDRLSSLPKTVIEAILIGLPLRDAVRTSILSKNWRYEWSNLPQLVFDKANFPLCIHAKPEYDSKLVKIVDRVLLLHQGPIHKFKLSILLASCKDIDCWILLVSRNGIREFILEKWSGIRYKIPSCLFSCKDITYLKLYKCNLIPPAASYSGLRNLRTLDLQSATFSDNGLENLISNCRFLKTLILKNITDCTHLKLYAPNLVYLEVEGPFQDICFEETPLLAKASINLGGGYKSFANGATCKLIDLLDSLPSIRKLELLEDAYMLLSAEGDVPVRLPTPRPLLHLSLTIDLEDTQELLTALCLFRSSPFLQKVDIISSTNDNDDGQNFWEAQEDCNCLFSRLQILNVSNYGESRSELDFIEFVLANAPILETVNIEVQDDVDDAVILRKLIRFRRISSKAEILVSE